MNRYEIEKRVMYEADTGSNPDGAIVNKNDYLCPSNGNDLIRAGYGIGFGEEPYTGNPKGSRKRELNPNYFVQDR